MKTIPHGLQFTGFFDELVPEKLSFQLLDFVARKDDYFSMSASGSELWCHCQLQTKEETVKPEGFDETVLQPFINEIYIRNWTNTEITFQHGIRMPSGLCKTELHQDEFFSISINRDDGTCEMKCRLREKAVTEALINQMIRELNVSEKPQKHSRNVSAQLEMKLLCDSQHLCNVCRHEGVVIHHMVSIEDGGRTVEDNLIVLCLTHHHQAHSKSLLTKNLKHEHLREYKARHVVWVAQQGRNVPLGQITGLQE